MAGAEINSMTSCKLRWHGCAGENEMYSKYVQLADVACFVLKCKILRWVLNVIQGENNFFVKETKSTDPSCLFETCQA